MDMYNYTDPIYGAFTSNENVIGLYCNGLDAVETGGETFCLPLVIARPHNSSCL